MEAGCIHVYFVAFVSALGLVFGYNEEYAPSTLNTCVDSCSSETLPSLILCTGICSQTPTCKGVIFYPEYHTCCTCSALGVPGQAIESGSILYRKTEKQVCIQDLVNYIPDDQLTASSTYPPYYQHAPSRARLHTVHGGNPILSGAWSSEFTSTYNLYIQARFNDIKEVMGIGTQGRNGKVPLQCVSAYTVSYSIDCIVFEYIKAYDGSNMLFSGNSDQDTIVWNDLAETLLAVCVKLHPLAFLAHPSMRFGIKGCNF